MLKWLKRLFYSAPTFQPLFKSEIPTDDEVAEAIRACPTHFANNAFISATGNTGTLTAVAPAGPGVVWNMSSLSVSQAGGTVGASARVTVYDGAVGGTVLFQEFLSAPGAGTWAGTNSLGGSVGIIQEVPLPVDAYGRRGIQASPGNALSVQVVGTGNNQVIINMRLSDGIPASP